MNKEPQMNIVIWLFYIFKQSIAFLTPGMPWSCKDRLGDNQFESNLVSSYKLLLSKSFQSMGISISKERSRVNASSQANTIAPHWLNPLTLSFDVI